MNDLDEIKDEIVSRGFPQLEDFKITTGYEAMRDAFLTYEIIQAGSHYHVTATNSLQNSPRVVVVGGMAHELAHILREAWMPEWMEN
jgi:hypothetical protein